MTEPVQELSPASTQRVRLRPIILPAEHGSWGLTLEPILLGLLVVPSLVGVLWAVAAFAAFLTHRPLKVALLDWRQGKRYARTRVAERFALLYGGLALAGGLGAMLLGRGQAVVPLLLALPFMAVMAWYEAQNEARNWQAEVCAPIAFSSVVSSIALAGGWPTGAAFALWGIMVARSLPAVLYVRARLRLEKGKPYNAALAVGAHGVALAAGAVAVWLGVIPWLTLLALAILLARAALGLSPYRRFHTAKQIGITEMVLGFAVVLVVAAGYWTR